MRLRSVAFAFVSLVSVPGFAQDAAFRRVQTEIYPILWNYEACATRHIRSVASASPGVTFQEIEISIRPACGAYIENARARLLAMGYDPLSAHSEIRAYYDVLRPKLMVAFEGIPRAPAPATTTAAASAEDVYVERARIELMKDLDDTHRNCLRRAVAAIVPYSNEPSEVLVEAVAAICMDYEQKRVKLIQVLFDAPREHATRAVEKVLEGEKRRVLAEIVTFRAMLAKRAAEQADRDPPTTGSIPKAASRGY